MRVRRPADGILMQSDNGMMGRLVAGVGGAALAVSVFLTWYSLSLADVLRAGASQLPQQLSGSLSGALPPGADLTLSWSGWHGVHAIRFVLLLVGVAVLARSLAPTSTTGNRQASFLLAGGLLTTVLAAYRIASPPGALDISVGPLQFPSPAGTGMALSSLLHVHAGPWVALVGGALVMLGGGLQLERAESAPAQPVPTYTPRPASEGATERWW
jgi:hypothetical protein